MLVTKSCSSFNFLSNSSISAPIVDGILFFSNISLLFSSMLSHLKVPALILIKLVVSL
jgi:hypothetical protein